MKIEGRLEAEALDGVLRHLGSERATGILTLQGEEDIIGVTFLDGEIVSADAVNQAPEASLGHLLVERGLLTREAVTTLLAEQEAGGPRMQDLVVEQGLVEPAELSEVLREKSLRLCSQALAWQRGRFRFYANDEIAYDPEMSPIGVEELLASRQARPKPSPAPVGDGRGDSALPALAPPAWGAEEFDAGEEGWLTSMGRSLGGPATATRTAQGLALLAVAALALLVWRDPARLYFPIGAERLASAAYAREQRSAFYLKVDRAAKAYYLLSGSFPESLPELVERGFLAHGDLGVSRNRSLAYADAPVSYLVLVEGQGAGESHRTETVADHFLLDPGFVSPEVVDAPPLVLLD